MSADLNKKSALLILQKCTLSSEPEFFATRFARNIILLSRASFVRWVGSHINLIPLIVIARWPCYVKTQRVFFIKQFSPSGICQKTWPNIVNKIYGKLLDRGSNVHRKQTVISKAISPLFIAIQSCNNRALRPTKQGRPLNIALHANDIEYNHVTL